MSEAVSRRVSSATQATVRLMEPPVALVLTLLRIGVVGVVTSLWAIYCFIALGATHAEAVSGNPVGVVFGCVLFLGVFVGMGHVAVECNPWLQAGGTDE